MANYGLSLSGDISHWTKGRRFAAQDTLSQHHRVSDGLNKING